LAGAGPEGPLEAAGPEDSLEAMAAVADAAAAEEGDKPLIAGHDINHSRQITAILGEK
jgi:hypothetical protein